MLEQIPQRRERRLQAPRIPSITEGDISQTLAALTKYPQHWNEFTDALVNQYRLNTRRIFPGRTRWRFSSGACWSMVTRSEGRSDGPHQATVLPEA